jgi:hypothetical protein
MEMEMEGTRASNVLTSSLSNMDLSAPLGVLGCVCLEGRVILGKGSG